MSPVVVVVVCVNDPRGYAVEPLIPDRSKVMLRDDVVQAVHSTRWHINMSVEPSLASRVVNKPQSAKVDESSRCTVVIN